MTKTVKFFFEQLIRVELKGVGNSKNAGQRDAQKPAGELVFQLFCRLTCLVTTRRVTDRPLLLFTGFSEEKE